MEKDIRQQLETAADKLKRQDDEKRVPSLIRKLGSFLTFVMVTLFTLFGLYAGQFYASQGGTPGNNGPLLTGIGLFLGLIVGTLTGVGFRKLLYMFFSR